MTPIFQKKTFFLLLLLINMSSPLLCSAAASGSQAPAAGARNQAPNTALQMRVACAQATAPIATAVGRVEAAQTEYQIENHFRQTTQTALLVHAHARAVQAETLQLIHSEQLNEMNHRISGINNIQALVLGGIAVSLFVSASIAGSIRSSSAPSPVCLAFSADQKEPMLCFPASAKETTIINVEKAVKMQKLFAQAINQSKKQSFTQQVKAHKKQCANARTQLKRNNRNQACHNPRASFNKKQK